MLTSCRRPRRSLDPRISPGGESVIVRRMYGREKAARAAGRAGSSPTRWGRSPLSFSMRRKSDRDWTELVEQWKSTQRALRQRMIVTPLTPIPRYVAGADGAFSEDKRFVFAAA